MKTYSIIDVLTGRARGLTEPRRIGCEHGEAATGETRGHRDDQPGLRGHSVGDAYPWRVVGRGDGSWTVEGSDGQVAYRTHDNDGEGSARAGRRARQLKILHPAGYVEETAAGPANISGDPASIPQRLAGRRIIIRYSDGQVSRLVADTGQPIPAAVTYRNLDTGHRGSIPVRYLVHCQTIAVDIELE